MESTGIILAALDCDLDVIEEWNRWYDLEHLPPNVALDGVMFGHRYVATPDLHALRTTSDASGFSGQRASFLTIYTLSGDPQSVFTGMSDLREELVAAGRMFPDEKKAVREGGVFGIRWTASDPVLKAAVIDVPFLQHTGIVVVQRRQDDQLEGWYRTTFAERAVAVPGVSAVLGYESLTRPGVALEIVLLEGDPAESADRLTTSVAHHPDAEVAVEAPFSLISPLRYPWADDLRSSGLPETVSST